MNQRDARIFIEKIYGIWTNGTADQLSSVYDPEIEASYFGYPNLGLSDLENRFHFSKKNHKKPKFQLQDLMVEGNKIAVRSLYSALTLENEPIISETIAIMHLNEKGKIQKIWSMGNTPINFIEKN